MKASLIAIVKPIIKENEVNYKGPDGVLTVLGKYVLKIPSEKQNFLYSTQYWPYIRYDNGQDELYNHKTAPYEWHNLAHKKKYNKIKDQLFS